MHIDYEIKDDKLHIYLLTDDRAVIDEIVIPLKDLKVKNEDKNK